MSVLKVANVHLETTGTNRIDYHSNGFTRIVSGGTGGIVINTGGTEKINVGTNVVITSNLILQNIDVIPAISSAFDKANTGGSGSLTTYSANVGNGAANTYNVSHNLNSYSLLMTMRENSTGYIIYPDLQQTTSNNLVISFVDNPTANQYALLIAKVT